MPDFWGLLRPQEVIGGVQVTHLEDLMREQADFYTPKARERIGVSKRVTLLGRMLQVEDRRFPDDAQRPWHDCAYALYRLEFLQGPATLH